MHLKYQKPSFDDMGTPIQPKDQVWHVVLYSDNHNTLGHGVGKTKVDARADLQRQINATLENKLRRYTAMLNFVTHHEVG